MKEKRIVSFNPALAEKQKKELKKLYDKAANCGTYKKVMRRVLEIKCFKNQINSYDLINFMRDMRVVKRDENSYINISNNQKVNEKIKKVTDITILDALYFSDKEINSLFEKPCCWNHKSTMFRGKTPELRYHLKEHL